MFLEELIELEEREGKEAVEEFLSQAEDWDKKFALMNGFNRISIKIEAGYNMAIITRARGSPQQR